MWDFIHHQCCAAWVQTKQVGVFWNIMKEWWICHIISISRLHVVHIEPHHAVSSFAKWGCFRVINSLWFWLIQDDVIKWIFSASLALCEGNPPAPVEFHYKGQWRRILMFTLICARTNDLANNRNAGELRRHRAHHDVTVMLPATVESSHIRIIYHKTFKIDSP